ncbi:hypothetical protein BH20VER3_BH20VER3_07060 [soil metagenome]
MTKSRLLPTSWCAAGILFFAGCSRSTFVSPEREGPPALVEQGKAPVFWLLLKQEEQRSRRLGGSRTIGKWITEIYYHFDLQAHDTATADRLWKKRLLTVKDDAGGRVAQARMLGREDDIVWMFLNDGPVAISSKDGSQLVDRTELEQRNPTLANLIPKDLDFYAYDGGLVIIAADGRRFRIRGADYTAEPYTPPNDEYFRQVQFMATRWNGGYHTRDFLVRQMNLDGRWIGFFDEKEAADAGDDGFGDKIATGEPGSNPDRVYFETSQARRTFWSARIGKTKEFTEGTHDRLFDVTRIPDAPEYLEAGLLIQQGTKKPLRLQNPDGFLVLHKTRIDEEGRLALTRLDDNFKTQWTATLPFHDLRNRYESPGHLLLYGIVQETGKGVTGTSEHLVALNLRDGKLQSWNVPAEKRGE